MRQFWLEEKVLPEYQEVYCSTNLSSQTTLPPTYNPLTTTYVCLRMINPFTSSCEVEGSLMNQKKPLPSRLIWNHIQRIDICFALVYFFNKLPGKWNLFATLIEWFKIGIMNVIWFDWWIHSYMYVYRSRWLLVTVLMC